jgi:hypothetical protein
LKQLREFAVCIRNNQDYIHTYGERCRNKERIATSFVESTVNQVVSKRMAKSQQMAWTERGSTWSTSVTAGANPGVERGIGRHFAGGIPTFAARDPSCWRQRPNHRILVVSTN